jgi:nucleoid-associated protein YgaU
MRRSIRYGALGVILLAGAATVWTWRGERPPAIHPELSQPAAVAAPAEMVAPAPKNADASAAIALPIAASGPTNAAMTASSGTTAAPSAGASFDVVRISPEGHAVIAGRAQPNAEVVALDGDTVIGRATADKHGEWVILPGSALPPGSHTLRVGAATPSDRPTTAQSDPISITVPAPNGPPAATLPALATSSTAPQPVAAAAPAATGAVPTANHAMSRPAAGNVAAGNVGQGKLAMEGVARDKSLIVRPGNSLWRIARQSYGAGDHYTIIYSANRDRIGDPDLIYPGQVFTLPSMN